MTNLSINMHQRASGLSWRGSSNAKVTMGAMEGRNIKSRGRRKVRVRYHRPPTHPPTHTQHPYDHVLNLPKWSRPCRLTLLRWRYNYPRLLSHYWCIKQCKPQHFALLRYQKIFSSRKPSFYEKYGFSHPHLEHCYWRKITPIPFLTITTRNHVRKNLE